MFELDMVTGEFADEPREELRRQPEWTPTVEMYAELRLLTVEEAEAQRR